MRKLAISVIQASGWSGWAGRSPPGALPPPPPPPPFGSVDAAPQLPLPAPPAPVEPEEPAGDPGGLARLRSAGLWLGAAVVAIAVLFATAQAATLINQIDDLPPALRPLGWAVLGLCAIVLAIVAAKLGLAYARLAASPRLNLDAQLALAAEARSELDHAQLADARRTLSALLRRHDIARARPGRLGLRQSEIAALRLGRETLLGDNAPATDAEWIAAYRTRVLSVLDAAAERRIAAAVKSVFVLTAASPRGGIDTIVVLVASYRMVGELSQIYGVRAGTLDTLRLLGRVIVHAVAAGQTDQVGDAAGRTFGDWLGHLTHGAAATLAGIAGQIAGKAAAGGVNALLIWRLGVRTQDFVRPVRA